MAIRVVVDATPLIGRRSGIGGFVQGLVPALLLLEDPPLDISAFALTMRGFDQLHEVLPAGIAHPHIPMPAGALMKTWARMSHPTIERWVGECDVVHGTNFVVPPSRRAGMLATVHDLSAIHFPQMCEPTTLRYPELIVKALQRGAHLHVQSETMAQEIIDYLEVHPGRVHTVMPGLPPVQDGEGTTAEDGKTLARAQRYILAVGTIEPRKDYPSLIRAFDAIADEDKEIELVIAGGEGWGIEAFRKAYEKANNRERIHTLGYVTDEQRSALMRGAELLAFPSVYEGFGMPPLEAMQLDLPVVATEAGSVPEVVGDAAELVKPRDDMALADAMSRVLQDDELRQRLIKAGQERVEAFSWQRCASEMAAVYQQLADESS